MVEKLKISGSRPQWDAAWSKVKVGDTVVASEPGFNPVSFEVTQRTGGDGFAPVQICGEGTMLYGAPWALEILSH